MEYIAGVWDEADCHKFGLDIGDCKGQAVWEALALLIVLRVWVDYWKEEMLAIMVKSDSKAALAVFEKSRSKSPNLNAIARDISLDRALATFEPRIALAHVKGKNK